MSGIEESSSAQIAQLEREVEKLKERLAIAESGWAEALARIEEFEAWIASNIPADQ